MNEELKNVQKIDDTSIDGAAGGAGRASWIQYTIKRGDTLTKIASLFGVPISQLCLWNNITDPDNIAVGHRLSIYINR